MSGSPATDLSALAASIQRRRSARASPEGRAAAAAVLRAAAATAAAAVAPLRVTALAASGATTAALTAAVLALNTERLPGAVCTEALSTRLGSRRARCLVTVDGGGALVGFVLSEVSGCTADVVLLAVTASQERRGHGRALLLAALSAAAEGGCTAVALAVRRDNAAALAMYASLGFVRIAAKAPGRNVNMQWCLPVPTAPTLTAADPPAAAAAAAAAATAAAAAAAAVARDQRVDGEVAALLSRARAGTSDSLLTGQPPIGPEGSAGWTVSATPASSPPPAPTTLILSDLNPPPADGVLPAALGGDVDSRPPLPPLDLVAGVTALDLSGNRLVALPAGFAERFRGLKVLFLGGSGPGSDGDPATANDLGGPDALPALGSLPALEHLSLHDTRVARLPTLPMSLRTLRIDRTPIAELGPPGSLPAGLTTLHLEGCPMPGTLPHPEQLPAAVRILANLQDLQLPDGCHIGLFFETPLPALLRARAAALLLDG